jgi:hypothetical protein
MAFFIYRWSGLNDLIAVCPKADSSILPSPEPSREWRLVDEIEESEFSKSHFQAQHIAEQISRYGYCLLQAEDERNTESGLSRHATQYR